MTLRLLSNNHEQCNANASKIGINPETIVVAGGSAGGNTVQALSLVLAFVSNFLEHPFELPSLPRSVTVVVMEGCGPGSDDTG